MPPKAKQAPVAMSAVYSTVLTYFDLHGRGKSLARSELMLHYGLSRIGLTMEEWEEFRRICRDAGVSASEELDTFRRMIQLLDRHGDDGYGDRPADMPRITYWFQHVQEPRSRYTIHRVSLSPISVPEDRLRISTPAPVTRDRSRSPRGRH